MPPKFSSFPLPPSLPPSCSGPRFPRLRRRQGPPRRPHLPDSVLILDSLKSCNFGGKLSSYEVVAFKLDTAYERKRSDGEKLLPDLEYYPSGRVVDGLGAAILARCQVMNVRASLCVSWPQFDASMVSLIMGLLQRCVLQGFDFDLSDEDVFKFGRSKDRVLHSELYI